MEAKEVITLMKRTKRDETRNIVYGFRVTPEEKEEIDLWFGTSTNLRDFLLDAIEVFKELKKQGKLNDETLPK